jgi:DNA repair exonuclease SbcCD nuclease subunit
MKAVLCADLHLRDTTPTCRADDFLEAQKSKFAYLIDFAVEHLAPIYCAGDMFHTYKVSPKLLNMVIFNLKKMSRAGLDFNVVYGQHDLHHHSEDELSDTALYLLQQVGLVKMPEYGHWYNNDKVTIDAWGIGMIHRFVASSKSSFMDDSITNRDVLTLLRAPDSKADRAKVIVCGDNHDKRQWWSSESDTYVVVPGPMTTQNVNEDLPTSFVFYDDSVSAKTKQIRVTEYPQHPYEVKVPSSRSTEDTPNPLIKEFVNQLSTLRKEYNTRFDIVEELFRMVSTVSLSDEARAKLKRMVNEYHEQH